MKTVIKTLSKRKNWWFIPVIVEFFFWYYWQRGESLYQLPFVLDDDLIELVKSLGIYHEIYEDSISETDEKWEDIRISLLRKYKDEIYDK